MSRNRVRVWLSHHYFCVSSSSLTDVVLPCTRGSVNDNEHPCSIGYGVSSRISIMLLYVLGIMVAVL